MKKTLLLFLFILANSFYAQEYIFGKITSEQNIELSGVLILNTRTDEKAYSDSDGNFMISAKNSKFILILISISAGLFSCVSPKKIYFVNDVTEQAQKMDALNSPMIQKIHNGDKVIIVVNCPDPSQTSFLNPFNNLNSGGNTSQNTLGFFRIKLL